MTLKREAGTKVLASFLVKYLALWRSGWLEVLVPCLASDNAPPNQLCGGGTTKSITTQYRFLSHSLSDYGFEPVFLEEENKKTTS